jgi:hypothetical protein
MHALSAPQISQTQLTGLHAAAGIEWLHEMSDSKKWNLTVEEVADLLGGIPTRSYHDLKRKALANQSINLSRDCLERISLLLGISKALQIVVPSGREDLAYAWFNQPNDHPIFDGRSVKKYLLERKSIEGLYTVRRYLDAARG